MKQATASIPTTQTRMGRRKTTYLPTPSRPRGHPLLKPHAVLAPGSRPHQAQPHIARRHGLAGVQLPPRLRHHAWQCSTAVRHGVVTPHQEHRQRQQFPPQIYQHQPLQRHPVRTERRPGHTTTLHVPRPRPHRAPLKSTPTSSGHSGGPCCRTHPQLRGSARANDPTASWIAAPWSAVQTRYSHHPWKSQRAEITYHGGTDSLRSAAIQTSHGQATPQRSRSQWTR